MLAGVVQNAVRSESRSCCCCHHQRYYCGRERLLRLRHISASLAVWSALRLSHYVTNHITNHCL